MSQAILSDKKVLITAGPTREAIDPVRFVSNHSTGKMGYAIAEEFLKQGAEVILVSGPVVLSLSHPRLTIILVESANEMYMACCLYFEDCDIAVFSAAVADYRPKLIATQKLKKDRSIFKIEMIKNVDIAAELGKHKNDHQITVGFALETNDELKHAISKLHSKNLDTVVLNSMNDPNAGFGHDTNKVTLINRDGERKALSLKKKREVAVDIVREVSKLAISKQIPYTISCAS